MVTRIAAIGILIGVHAAVAAAQSPAVTTPSDTDGIPIQSELVRSRCGTCHRVDDQMRMTRISYRRATPENWERTIKRMVTLNHAALDVNDARDILKYLADHNGLAPSEAKAGSF